MVSLASNVVIEWLACMLNIQEVWVHTLFQRLDSLTKRFLGLPSASPVQCHSRNSNEAITASFHIPYNSLFTDHSIT